MPEARITINKILEEYGELYQKRGQGMNSIRRAMLQGSVTLEKHFTHISSDDDVLELANDFFEEVIQPFREEFEDKGGVKFVPNKIILQHIKVDTKLRPYVIYHSWLGFLAGGQNKIEDWPITRYYTEVYLKKQIDRDRETKAVYKGRRRDNGTGAADCMDGIKVLLERGARNTENPINVIQGIGELHVDTVLDQLERYDKAIDEMYEGETLIHFVAPKFVRALKENKRASGWYFIESPDQIDTTIDFTKHVVCGLPSMKGTTDVFTSVKENCLWLTQRNKFDFDMQKVNRYIKVLADWQEAVGFAVNAMVWTTAETVGLGTATDTASPADGIVSRNLAIVLDEPKNITDTAASLSAEIIGELPEGATVTFKHGTSADSLSSSANATEDAENPGNYSANLTGLSRNTKIYYRLEVAIGTDKYASATASLTTAKAEASLTELAVSSVTKNSASVGLTYSDPSETVTAGGVEITTDLTATPTSVAGSPSAGSMTVSLTSLTADTTYHVRAFITTAAGTKHSSWTTFTTPES